MKELFKYLKPFTLSRERGISQGLLGGSNAWLAAGALAWAARGVRRLFQLGEPTTRYARVMQEGERLVLVHEPEGPAKQKKRAKKAVKADKKANKLAAKSAKRRG